MAPVPRVPGPPPIRLPRFLEVETSRQREPGRGPRGGGAPSTPAPAEGRDPADLRREAAAGRQELMAWPLFDKIVRELGELGYGGWWGFHHCCEPLLNPRLVREVEHVRALVPAARPAILTSGDLLTPGLLVDLLQLGAGYVRITRYPRHPHEEPAYEPVRQWLVAGGLLESLPWHFVEMRHGWAAVYEQDGLRVDVIRPRLRATAGTARLPDPREQPPVRPTPHDPSGECATADPERASIDCSGEMATCRTVFADRPACGRHTIGNLQERSFADLWSSPTMARFHDPDAGTDGSPWPTEGIYTERYPVVVA